MRPRAGERRAAPNPALGQHEDFTGFTPYREKGTAIVRCSLFLLLMLIVGIASSVHAALTVDILTPTQALDDSWGDTAANEDFNEICLLDQVENSCFQRIFVADNAAQEAAYTSKRSHAGTDLIPSGEGQRDGAGGGEVTLMPLPTFSSTYTTAAATYGYWFTAPVAFVIIGLRVPDEAGHGLQNVEVVRFNNNGPPPSDGGVTDDFTSLVQLVGQPSAGALPVYIPVAAGDVIGILGAAGDASALHHSYALNNASSSIGGQPVTLVRMRMQHNLAVEPASELRQDPAAANLARVEMYYQAGVSAPLPSQSVSLDWAVSAGGASHDYAFGISPGSAYVSGQAGSEAIFGAGTASEVTLPAVVSDQAFLAKYDVAGGLEWVKNPTALYAVGTAVQPTQDGNQLWEGLFTGSVTLGAGEATETTLTCPIPSISIFLAKLKSDGGLLWARKWCESSNSVVPWSGNSIEVLPDGSVIMAYNFQGAVTIGPGEPNAVTLNATDSDEDSFFARMNADGSLAWVQQVSGVNRQRATGVALLSDGTIMGVGHFRAEAVLAPGQAEEVTFTETNAGTYETFVARYSASGTLLWAREFPDGYARAVTAGPDGSSYVAGLNGITKYYSDGSIAWQREGAPVDSGSSASIRSMIALTGGELLAGGNLRGAIAFGAGERNETVLNADRSSTDIATGALGKDIFVTCYEDTGALKWAQKMGGVASEYLAHMSLFQDENTLLISGDFHEESMGYTSTFGLGEPNETTLTSAGLRDIFIAQFSLSTTAAFVDTDGDGLPNFQEAGQGCDFLLADASLAAVIDSPSDRASFGAIPIEISVHLTSAYVDEVRLSTDGGSSFITNVTPTNLAWSYSWIPPSTGSYTIVARAINVFGGYTDSAPLTVHYRPSYPKAVLASPISSSHLSSVVPIAGTVQAAPGFGLSAWRLEYHTGTDPAAPSGWVLLKTASTEVNDNTLLPAWDVSGLTDGPYVLRLKATDASGFVSSTTHVVVEVDSDVTPPVAPGDLEIAGSVLPGVVTVGNTLELTGLAEPETFVEVGRLVDTSTGMELLDVSTAITIHHNGSIRGTLPLPNPLTASSVSLELTVRDAVGNVSPAGLSNIVLVDTSGPTVTINFPFASATLPLAQVVVTGQAQDVGAAGVALVEFSTNQTNWFAATGTTGWSYNWTPAANGGYTLYARATDNLGNTGSNSVAVTVSNVYPTAYITSPAQGAVISEGASVPITGTASDPTNFDFYILQYAPGISPLSGYTNITGQMTTPVTDGALGTWDTTGRDEGFHTLRLFVFDLSGNFVRFDKIVDIRARVSLGGIPDALLNEDTSIDDFVHLPDYASVLNGDPENLSYTLVSVSDANAGVSIDAGKNIDIAPAANWNGSATVTVRASDGSNTNDDVFEVTVNPVNDLPTQPVIAIAPLQPVDANNLICAVTTPSTDGDGQQVSYLYDWFEASDGVSFAPIRTASTTLIFDTLNASLTSNGKYYRCRVTPQDGVGSGPSATATVRVRLASSLSAAVNPTAITLGEGLTINGTITGTLGQGTVVSMTTTSPSGVVDPNFPEAAVAGSTSYTRTFYPTEASAGRPDWQITASWPGDATYHGATSPTRSFSVAKAQPTITVDLSSSSVPVSDPEFDATLTLTAPLHSSLLPLLANQPVKLSVRDPFGATTVINGATGASGIAAFPYTAFSSLDFSQAGTWQFLAIFEADDNFLQATSANFDTPNAARLTVRDGAGYAILCVGRLDENVEGLPEHTKTAEFAYNAFRDRGFGHEDIYYLSAQAPAGGVDIVVDDATPSEADLLNAIGGWASTEMNNAAAPLYVVLIGHGSDDAFYLYDGVYGPQRILTPLELDDALSTLEGTLEGPAIGQAINIIYGACHSGSFIDEVSAPGRVLITSSEADEISHRGVVDPGQSVVRDGEPFVTELFRGLREGATLKAVFEEAALNIEQFTSGASGEAPQNPLLDDNGDTLGSRRLQLTFEPGFDGAAAHQTVLGFGANAAGDSVGWVSASHTVILAPGQALSLTARATESPSIGHTAWVEVKTPTFGGAEVTSAGSGPENNYGEFQQFLDLEVFASDNSDPGDGNFTWANFGTTFDTPGTYRVYYYLKDGDTEEISAYLLTTVYRQSASNTAPPAVALTYPADAATVSTSSFFVWAPSIDPDGDAVTYRVEFATDAGFTQNVVLLEGAPGTFAQVPGLVDGRTYLWRVVPIDAFGASPGGALPTRTVSMNNSNPVIPGGISGEVRSAGGGQPIAGALVRVFRNGQLQAEALSDALGEFFVPNLPPDTYQVQIVAAGFAPGFTVNITVFGGQATTTTTIDLPVFVGITGDVNLDGAVTALDATLINLYVLAGGDVNALNAILPPDVAPMQPQFADVNRVDEVTTLDATLVNLEQLMGKPGLNAYLAGKGLAISHSGEALP